MPSDFIHLHLHSHYSYLDGISKIKPIVAKTVEFGQPAVALTDHGNMFGAMELFHVAKDSGVKPIYGTEVYIAENNRFERKKGEKRFHLVLLAKDVEGYKNLVRLSSAGFLDGFYYKPRIDKELLREHSKGLVAMSACLSGELPWMIHDQNEQGLSDALDYYIDVFGKDNFFLEVQNHGLPDQLPVNKRLIELARKTGLGLVATNDSHYVNKGDNILQEIMFCIRDKKTLDNPDRFKYDSPEFYIKSPDEMSALFAELPESITNTRLISEMCSVDLGAHLKGKDHLPRYPLPANETADSYLSKLCREGLTERFGSGIREDYEARLASELELISRMGFSNYFLVVSDFVRYARRNGILVGPGRGSAAGALVSYALRITNIDPIKYDLLFERFLNPERVTMPDIDIDFEDERRDEVKEYIRSAYGYKKTSDIITFGVLQAKAALKDVGRVLDIPYEEVNKVTGLIPGKLALNNSLPELLELVPELRAIQSKGTALQKKWIDYSIKIEGTIRNLGFHASGMIIADETLSEIVPMYMDTDDNAATQFEGNYLEENGLLKMDILGLSNLTIIRDCLNRVRKNHHVEVDLDTLEFTDPRVYQIISKGETSGLFQLESDGITEMLKRMQPSRFEDVIASLALYRPGPLNSGMVADYIERKHGRAPITYPHPSLEPVLENTYGVIVYQEQVMKIAQVVAGFSLGGADNLRRAVAKKKADLMAKISLEFIDGAKQNGVNESVARGIFDLIEKFAEYGFNKSHSAAYAMVTYFTAYLKVCYRAEFMAALMTLNSGDADKLKAYVQECKSNSIDVLPPDINTGEWKFVEKGNAICYGLGAIKGLGEGVVNAIVAERERRGLFASFEDFIERIMDVGNTEFKRSSVELLLKSGALDCLFASDRILQEKSVYLAGLGSYIAQLEKNRREKSAGFMGLFGDEDNGGFDIHLPRNVPPLTPDMEFANEVETLGFHLSNRLFARYKKHLGELTTYRENFASELHKETGAFIWGYVGAIAEKLGKTGKPYGILNFETDLGMFRLMLFSEKYDLYKPLLEPNKFLCIRLTIREGQNGKINHEVVKVFPIERIREERFTQMHIYIDSSGANGSLTENLKEFRNKVMTPQNSGNVQLVFHTFEHNLPVTILAEDRYRIRYSQELIQTLKEFPHLKGYWMY